MNKPLLEECQNFRYGSLTLIMPTQASVAASPTAAGGERGEAGKRKNDCDTQPDTERSVKQKTKIHNPVTCNLRSSISTTSSATSTPSGNHWTSSSANKLSKVRFDNELLRTDESSKTFFSLGEEFGTHVAT